MKIIVWSGGADSTLLLAKALDRDAKLGGPPRRVAAITLDHHQLSQDQLRLQREAMARFKKWALAKKGWKFDVHPVKVSSKVYVPYGAGQFSLWCSHIPLYAAGIAQDRSHGEDEKTEVQFGYVKRDIFWHVSDRFMAAFNALATLSEQHRLQAVFPLEWYEKTDVLDELHLYGVPRSCWWTCEEPKRNRPCGTCGKCVEIAGWKPKPKPKKLSKSKASKVSLDRVEMKETVRRRARKARR